MTVGCNPRSHPTTRYIAAHPEKFALPGAPKPLKDVKAGGGKCDSAKDCNGGGNSGYKGGDAASKVTQGWCESKKCRCAEDFTGPNCLVSGLVFLYIFCISYAVFLKLAFLRPRLEIVFFLSICP